uniref:Minor capsid protein P9 transmembrane helices domain-containing protein n=1 Tax=viral metagenome TaxID=1070528 RepID=A0A6C0IIN5_9ZZZZ
MATSFWLNNPTILLKQTDILEIWPAPTMSADRKLNAITRLIIILTIIGFLITRKGKFLITGVVTLVVIIVLQKIQSKKGTDSKEGFMNADMYKKYEMYNNEAVYQENKQHFTEPAITNPAMNVLLTEIADNPNRNPAAPAFNPEVDADINKQTIDMVKKNFDDPNIDQRLFKDLGDSYTFDQSMRTWYATANTTIPNDQGSFAEFCYGDMISCRDETNNEAACTRNAPPRWTNY